ncbi:MAG TPA: hypothetical protein VFV07_14080 [Rhizomicrobium sp.]|nr:hypothetical protein [Rhizomicrobium sp.]
MTTRKICLMGDSQAGALKLGWNRIHGEFPHVEITFFAGRSTDWHSVTVSDRKLVPGAEHLRDQLRRSSRGLEEISADYDAYMICGIGLGFGRPLGLWTDHAHQDWESYRTAVAAFVRGSGCAYILAKLREITAMPALILPAPFQHSGSISRPLDDATAARLRANFFGECEKLAAEHGAVLATQPPQTVAADGISTRTEFAAPAPPDAPRRDRYHCNEDYGALVMANVLKIALRPIAD